MKFITSSPCGYGMVIYFIMQSSFEKISKKLTLFAFSTTKSAVRHLAFLTASAAITPHTKSYAIAALTMHSFVKFKFSIVLLFLYVTIHGNGVE